MSKHTSYKTLSEVFFGLCKVIDSPVSLGRWLRYKHGEFSALVSDTIRPEDYLDADSFRDDYLCSSFLSKYTELDTEIDTRKTALRSFKSSEDVCRATNQRFRFGAPHGAYESLIFKVSRKISDILGPIPDLVEFYKRSKWGPGATFDISRLSASRCLKQSVIPSVTRHALPYAKAYVSGDYHWFHAVTGVKPDGPFSVTDSFFEIVVGNRVVTVPKNAKTDRTIAAEPTMNGFIQQGIGRYIRSRLKRFGVDLNNQEINKAWASSAHDLDLCTLDLKAASDTIARNLISEVLPQDWAFLLDSIRSHVYEDPEEPGSFLLYEKFSSMGNAFTFELESLIFYAIVVSVCELHNVPTWGCSVYGDDIVAPASVSAELIAALTHFGFAVNTEKSYVRGLFFESCGGHYFGSTDVTPAYQKKLLEGPELVRCHNRLVRHGLRRFGGDFLDSRVWRVCLSLRRFASTYRSTDGRHTLIKCKIPANSDGDDGFLAFSFEQDGLGAFVPGLGYHCNIFKLKTRKVPRVALGELAHYLRSENSFRLNSLWELDDLEESSFRTHQSPRPSQAGDLNRLGSSVRLGCKRRVIPTGCYYAELI